MNQYNSEENYYLEKNGCPKCNEDLDVVMFKSVKCTKCNYSRQNGVDLGPQKQPSSVNKIEAEVKFLNENLKTNK